MNAASPMSYVMTCDNVAKNGNIALVYKSGFEAIRTYQIVDHDKLHLRKIVIFHLIIQEVSHYFSKSKFY